MTTNFLVKAVAESKFRSLMKSNNEVLASQNARWITVDATPGYPCRVSLVDANIGEKVLALNFTHHDVKSPYKASGPIFVRENATMAEFEMNEVPKLLRHRFLSVRAYNATNMMVGTQLAHGAELESAIKKQFQDPETEYIHIHNAGPGCFNCSIYRA